MRLKLSKRRIIYWGVWFSVFLYCFLAIYKIIEMPSPVVATILSVIVFCIINIYPIDNRSNSISLLGLTHVHILYTSLSSFGLAWIYYFWGESEALKSVSSGVISSIFYLPTYSKAIILSSLAFLCYSFAVNINIRNYDNKKLYNDFSIELYYENKINNFEKHFQMFLAWTGVFFIFMFFLFIMVMILTGKISLKMSYTTFMERVSSNDIYSYLILLYSVGICYIIACAEGNVKIIGLALYTVVAIVLLITGNRGEVFYALLACLGMVRRKGKKLNWKIIIGLLIIVFVFIPFISQNRSNGVINELSKITVSFTGFLAEIGGQLRCTTVVIDQFENGSRSYLYGYSYYNPIINIFDRMIPFVNLRISQPSSFNFKEIFASWGFNQVAEGYANLGVLGSCLYFYITGSYLAKCENNKGLHNSDLAFYGSICAVLINVSRNKFAFFWGQILIILFIYYFIKIICNRLLINKKV